MPLLPLLLVSVLNGPIQEPPDTEPPTTPLPPVTQPTTPPPAMDNVLAFAEPARLAMTPLVDGSLEPDEWDPLLTLADGARALCQWEPNAVHFAAEVPAGQDAVFSWDADDDGWLVGRRNVEIRMRMTDGKPVLIVRRLDGMNVSGPTWVDLPVPADLGGVAARETDGKVVFEASLKRYSDAFGPLANGQKVGLRFDHLSPEDFRAPFMPRALSGIRLVMIRANGLPEGTTFDLGDNPKSVVPGERTALNLVFRGVPKPPPQKITLKAIGGGRSVASVVESPFPPIDKKNRATMPYETFVAGDARPGYAVVRGTLVGADGVPGTVDASFRIAEPADIDLVNRPIPSPTTDESVRLGYYVRSNSTKPIRGEVTVATSGPVRILNSATRKFAIETRRGRSRLSFDVYVPPRTSGSFPVTFTIKSEGRTYTDVQYITVGD